MDHLTFNEKFDILINVKKLLENNMQIFNNFQELMANATVGGQTQSELFENAEFIGEPDQWNHFDAERLKQEIVDIEDEIIEEVKRARRPKDPDRIRSHIDRMAMSMVDRLKDGYADIGHRKKSATQHLKYIPLNRLGLSAIFCNLLRVNSFNSSFVFA